MPSSQCCSLTLLSVYKYTYMSLYCYKSTLPLSTVGHRGNEEGSQKVNKQSGSAEKCSWCLAHWGCQCYFETAINITLSLCWWVSQWIISFRALQNKSRHALSTVVYVKLLYMKNQIIRVVWMQRGFLISRPPWRSHYSRSGCMSQFSFVCA